LKSKIVIGIAISSVVVSALLGACSSSSSNGFANGDGGTGSQDGATGGGDSASGGEAGPSADATKACNDSAAAFCAQLQSCAPFALQAEFGDSATCATRFALGCLQTLAFPGTSANATNLETCASAIPAVSCSDFVVGNLGNACNTKAGTLANGANCGDDAQCTSTFCARAPDSQCGVCSPVSTAGGACVNQACSTGFACPTGGSKCQVPVAGQIGDSCQSQSDCDLAHAVGCNTNNNKCLKLEIATSGGSCGADSVTPTMFTICPANGTCDALLNGNCHSAAADGAACSTSSSGPTCLSPAKCVGSICTLPDATKCQ
jgi:hypothetical protein